MAVEDLNNNIRDKLSEIKQNRLWYFLFFFTLFIFILEFAQALSFVYNRICGIFYLIIILTPLFIIKEKWKQKLFIILGLIIIFLILIYGFTPSTLELGFIAVFMSFIIMLVIVGLLLVIESHLSNVIAKIVLVLLLLCCLYLAFIMIVSEINNYKYDSAIEKIHNKEYSSVDDMLNECRSFKIGTSRDWCILTLALKEKNLTLCNELTQLKDQCLRG